MSLKADGDPHRPGPWHRCAADRRLSRPMRLRVSCMMPHGITLHRENPERRNKSQSATWALMRATMPRSLGHVWYASKYYSNSSSPSAHSYIVHERGITMKSLI